MVECESVVVIPFRPILTAQLHHMTRVNTWGSVAIHLVPHLNSVRRAIRRAMRLACLGEAYPLRILKYCPSIFEWVFISTTGSLSCPIIRMPTICRCVRRPATHRRNSFWPSVTPSPSSSLSSSLAVLADTIVGLGSASISGLLGSLRMSGVQANWGSSNPLWMGFAKVLGSQNQTPLALQG